MSTSTEYWRIGRLLKPWGRRGEWLAAPDNGDPRRFARLERLFIRVGGDYRAAALESATVRGGRVMLKLAPDAPCAPHAELYLPADEIRGDDADAELPYEHELIGATLADPAGQPLGMIRALRPGPQGELLVVECAGQERWIPYLAVYAPRFDRAARQLRMDLPPGLVNDADAVEVDPPGGIPAARR
jgi:ribosomal 30S subunit maturation factor RimM